MKNIIYTLLGLFIGASTALAADVTGLPACKVQMMDEFNMPVTEIEWKDSFYSGMIIGNGLGILVTASLGSNQVMSLWVRDKKTQPNGMFSFVDLSSGREQRHALYLANGYHIETACKWVSEQK